MGGPVPFSEIFGRPVGKSSSWGHTAGEVPRSGWNGTALLLTMLSSGRGATWGEPWHPGHGDGPKRWQLRLSGNYVGDQTDTFLGSPHPAVCFPTCRVVTALRVRYQQTIRAVKFLLANLPVPAIVLLRISWDPLMGSADLSLTVLGN